MENRALRVERLIKHLIHIFLIMIFLLFSYSLFSHLNYQEKIDDEILNESITLNSYVTFNSANRSMELSKPISLRSKDVKYATIKANVPYDIKENFKFISFPSEIGSFVVYAGEELIMQFPHNSFGNKYYDLGSRKIFTIECSSDLRGKSITVALFPPKGSIFNKYRVYPITLSTQSGAYNSLSFSASIMILFSSFHIVMLLFALYIMMIINNPKYKRVMLTFILFEIPNIIITISRFKANILIYNNPLLWITLENAFLIFAPFVFIHLVNVMCNINFLKSKALAICYYFIIILFIIHTLANIFGHPIAASLCKSFKILHLLILSLLNYKIIKERKGTPNYNSIIYSSICFTLAALSSTLFNYLFTPSTWQLIISNIFRVACISIIVLVGSASYLKVAKILLSENELKKIVYTDSLSLLSNRRSFDRYINNSSNYVGKRLAIIEIDINGLKKINDYFGHNEGDKLIKHCGLILKSTLEEDAKLFRIGGDEFICIINYDNTKSLNSIIKQLKEQYKESSPYSTTISVGGLSVKAKSQEEFSQALKQTDELMYRDKRNKDNWSFFENARMVSDVLKI